MKTTYANGTFTTQTFDKDNRVTSSTDAADNTTNYEYDSNNMLTETILPAVPDPANGGKLTRPEYVYTYDSYGNMLSMTDPLGNKTSFSYDPYDDQTSETLPGGQSGLDPVR